MKKNILRVIALVLVAVFCFALCGCQELDELKANQAFWGEDTNTIIWNGKTYTCIDTYMGDYEILSDKFGFVTENGVPVLAARMLENYTGFSCSKDKSVLELNGSLYVDAENYNAIKALVEGGLKDAVYCVDSYNYENNQYEYFWKPLDSALQEYLNILLTDGIPADYDEFISENYNYITELRLCDKGLKIGKRVGTVFGGNGKFYLLNDYGAYEISDEFTETLMLVTGDNVNLLSAYED